MLARGGHATRRACGSTAASWSSGATSSTGSTRARSSSSSRSSASSRRASCRVPLRGVLGPDGHDQGQAAPRGLSQRPGKPPWRRASAAEDDRVADVLTSLLSLSARRPLRASSRSARTPTTSRSAAAGRCSRSCGDPELEVDWVVLAAPGARAGARPSQRRGVPGRRRLVDVEVHAFRDGYFPYVGGEVKDVFESLKGSRRPGRDLHARPTRPAPGSPARLRAHLEHLAATTSSSSTRSRSTTATSGGRTLYVPLADDDVGAEARAARAPLPEQRDKHWFDDELFLGLMRLRGMEAVAPTRFAEAFTCRSSCSRASANAGRTSGLSRNALARVWAVRDAVLVTGHHGYIGSVLAPFLATAGHDVVGLDTFLYRGCDFGSSAELQPALSTDVRDVTPRISRDSTRSSISRRSRTTRSATSTPGWTYADQPRRHGRARARPRRTPASAASSSRRRARCTARRGPTTRSTRLAPLRPLTAVRRVEGSARRRRSSRPRRTTDFAPVSMRNATVYGASPRLRLDIVLNNLAAWAHTTGRSGS